MKRKRIVSLLLSAAMAFTMAAVTLPTIPAMAASTGVTMYRLYNPNSGEHFYTKDASERDNLVSIGWKSEGTAWTAPTSSNTPVYRVYNPNSGEHHYTKDAGERSSLVALGWNYEGIGWYSDDNQGTPLYRLYNPNATGAQEAGGHHYTRDVSEKNSLIAAGWKDEGIGWYGLFDENYFGGEGRIINIHSWDDEFKSRVENYYPGYIKTGETTGKIGNVEVKFTITSNQNNAYQNNLDKLLANNSRASADDKVDIFLIEGDSVWKYVDADANVALKLSDIGITAYDLSDQFKYTQDILTDKNGDVRSSAWRTNPGGIIYNRAIAKAVLGTDDPEEVQKAVRDWGRYNETAAKMKAAGYLMTATTDDTYRAYSNNVSAPWVKDNKVTTDSNLKIWADDSKAQVDSGQTTTGFMWSYEWSEGFKAPGTVFCYFGPAWFYNYSMGNSRTSPGGDDGSIAYRGGWGFCEGPQAFYWGFDSVCAANGTDNPTLVKDIIKTMTTDKAVLKKIALNYSDCVNSKSVLKDLAGSADGNNKILGGQNPYRQLVTNAEKIDATNTCPYDQRLNELFQAAMKEYFKGTSSYDGAVQAFQKAVKQQYPNLTF